MFWKPWPYSLRKLQDTPVTGEQDELILDSIVGHRDCVIDGCLSTLSLLVLSRLTSSKVVAFLIALATLINWTVTFFAAKDDPLVTNKSVGYILAIDKQLGHMCLYKHEVSHERQKLLRERIVSYKQISAQSVPPGCRVQNNRPRCVWKCTARFLRQAIHLTSTAVSLILEHSCTRQDQPTLPKSSESLTS